ncbi:hypothetical protein D3C84_722620 [compost metagenome]
MRGHQVVQARVVLFILYRFRAEVSRDDERPQDVVEHLRHALQVACFLEDIVGVIGVLLLKQHQSVAETHPLARVAQYLHERHEAQVTVLGKVVVFP